MVHLRDVHHHLDQAARAHRQSHEEALREAAVARAQLEAQPGSDGQETASEGNVDAG